MNVYRPLRATLFIYELLRLLLLVVFCFAVPAADPAGGAFFPHSVYLSANVLFPLAALFVWLRLREYGNYLNLYIAGKVIVVVLFCMREILGSREFPAAGNLAASVFFLGGGFLLCLMDILSVAGAWMLKNKMRQIVQKAEVCDADYSGSEREGRGW